MELESGVERWGGERRWEESKGVGRRGVGWEGYWYAHAAIIAALYRIIFGNRNVQAAYNASKDANGLYQGGFGAGVTTGWPASFENRPFMKTSQGVSLGDACGLFTVSVTNSSSTVEKTYNAPCFFGLKNFFGYLGRWERGALINKIADGSGDVYVLPSMHSTYSMNSLNGMVKAATLPANSVSGWQYIMELSNNMLCHTPTVTGTVPTETTFYCDGLYNDNAVSGLRVPCRGGHANNKGNAGLECLSASHGVSTSHANVGSPLCERTGTQHRFWWPHEDGGGHRLHGDHRLLQKTRQPWRSQETKARKCQIYREAVEKYSVL